MSRQSKRSLEAWLADYAISHQNGIIDFLPSLKRGDSYC